MYKITVKDINEYLDYKRNLGFKYTTVEIQLKNYLEQYDVLSEENIEKWINNPKFSDVYKKGLVSSVNGFIKYLINIKDIKTINLLDIRKYRCRNNYVPRIYSEEEMKTFFSECENYLTSTKDFPYKKEMFILIYKLAYCAGLRTNEIRHIIVENINFSEKSIFIKSSKNNIDRNIYVDDNIMDECHNIIKHLHLTDKDFLFCDINRNILGKSIIINNFKRIWLKIEPNADIRTIRTHNLRHSFAVYNLKKWFIEKEDLYSKLPILMTYMGHTEISSTEYYLRMLPDVFPDIINNFEKKFGFLIKDGRNYE